MSTLLGGTDCYQYPAERCLFGKSCKDKDNDRMKQSHCRLSWTRHFVDSEALANAMSTMHQGTLGQEC
jgi:hypothetical protein